MDGAMRRSGGRKGRAGKTASMGEHEATGAQPRDTEETTSARADEAGNVPSAAEGRNAEDGGAEGRTEGLGPIFRREVYAEYVKRHARPSPLLRDMGRAALVGGGLCAAGEGGFWLLRSFGVGEEEGRLFVTLFFILLAGVFTAVGLFDRIARFGGAGTLVPVTGFSNSVVAASMDSRSEGLVTGVGAKMFTVAGPVIVYGTVAGTAFGVILWLLGWIGDKM